MAALVMSRDGDCWIATAAIAGDTLAMPEIGLHVPLDEFCLGMDFAEAG